MIKKTRKKRKHSTKNATKLYFEKKICSPNIFGKFGLSESEPHFVELTYNKQVFLLCNTMLIIKQLT